MSKVQRKLNKKQQQILKLIYKFRFITAALLAEHRKVDKWSIQNALNILSDYGYVTKRYDKSYKIDHRPASYHLTNNTLKLLRDEYGLNEQVLHARYKDGGVGQPFIDHSLAIFKLYTNIKKDQPDTFNVFTKAELHEYDYFPKPLPNLYVDRINPSNDKPSDYMIDTFDDSVQTFVIKKRIDQFIEHFDDGDWVEDDYPSILLLVSNTRLVETLNNYIENKRDNAFIEDEELILQAVASRDNLLKFLHS